MSVSIPQHIFISYSHHDKKLVDKLATKLRRNGIHIWLDRQNLTPGSPNWEQTIRDAIANSFVVVLIASPNSRQSITVLGELAVAESQRSNVLPIWIAGDEWIDSAPLSLIKAQYIDCRLSKYETGVLQLLATLKEIIDARLPKHLIFTNEEYKKSQLSVYLSRYYIHIDLGNGSFVVMRVASYQSLRILLDDLYMEYLRDRYEPFTYGKNWILGFTSDHFMNHQQLLASWSWLLKPDIQSLSTFEPYWSDSSPEVYGLKPDLKLEIIDKFPIQSYGIVTNDLKIASLLSGAELIQMDRKNNSSFFSKKERYALFLFLSNFINTMNVSNSEHIFIRSRLHLEKFKVESINVSSFKYNFIFKSNSFYEDKFAIVIKNHSSKPH